MHSLIASVLVGAAAGSAVTAQEALTYSFDGRVGLGYLSEETARPSSVGYQYKGPVAKVELSGRAELLVMQDLRFGALGRISYLRGNQSIYDRTFGGISTPSSFEFGGSETDLAVYTALPNVTLSYGNMETAFDLATREIEQGSSLLDGGNAVWMNLGDAAGSTGVRGYPSIGAVVPDYRTLRLDLHVGELTFSVSRSDDGGAAQVDAAGAVWRHETDSVALFVGAGYDKGPLDRFHSFSFGFTSGGLNVVINRIHRKPIIFNPIEPDYDTSFDGLSLSYDFGDFAIGIANSSQRSLGQRVFDGKAKAAFVSWRVREDISVEFEYSESDYRIGSAGDGSGFDTRKASVAVALEF